jgi:hypothetical protein
VELPRITDEDFRLGYNETMLYAANKRWCVIQQIHDLLGIESDDHAVPRPTVHISLPRKTQEV